MTNKEKIAALREAREKTNMEVIRLRDEASALSAEIRDLEEAERRASKPGVVMTVEPATVGAKSGV